MTERNDGTNLPLDYFSEESKNNINTAWQNLFLSLQELSKIREEPANTFVPTAGIKTGSGNLDSEYFLRVNPGLLSPEGNIEIVVLDVTYLGEPSQQWVAKAEWKNGQPKLVGLDVSIISEDGIDFGSQDIAQFAENTVKKYQYAFLLERGEKNSILSAPDGFSTGIN